MTIVVDVHKTPFIHVFNPVSEASRCVIDVLKQLNIKTMICRTHPSMTGIPLFVRSVRRAAISAYI